MSSRPAAKGILLVSAGGLGDTILFSLVLPRLVAMARNGEPVTLLIRREAAKMAFLLPSEITVMAVDFHKLRHSLSYRRKQFGILFRNHYRLAISTDFLRHPDLDCALIRAAAADQPLAMRHRPWPKHERALSIDSDLYTDLFESGPLHVDKVVRWTRFIDWLTGETAPPPRVRLPEEISIEPTSSDIPDVFIQPFSAVTLKQSSPLLFRNIIERLPKGTRVAITGTPGDLKSNPQFDDLMKLPNVSFDSATFADLSPKLKAARLVISVDTAVMHLAVSLGTPTLGLASAAYVGEIVPYADEITPDNAHIIYQPMDCQGCLGACMQEPVDGMYPCVAKLEPGRIFAVIDELTDSWE